MPEFLPIDWNQVDVVVADLDGTLYLGDSPLPGAIDFVRSCPKPLFFLSNNTSKTPQHTLEKLHSLGFPAQQEQILSPLHSLIAGIRTAGYQRLWVMANRSVMQWLREALPEREWKAPRSSTECVVITYDDECTYSDMCEVAWRLQDGATYWITHPDLVCPAQQGPMPDVGSFIELWYAATGRKPGRCFGKPNCDVLNPILETYSPQRTLFLGDRLYTDWALAKHVGCQFRLLLTGETTPKDWEQLHAPRPFCLEL